MGDKRNYAANTFALVRYSLAARIWKKLKILTMTTTSKAIPVRNKKQKLIFEFIICLKSSVNLNENSPA